MLTLFNPDQNMRTSKYRAIASSASSMQTQAQLQCTIKLEEQEETIPSRSHQSPVPHGTPPPPVGISKPKRKAYYAVKPELQKYKSPTPKAPIPHLTRAVLQELREIWKCDPRVPTIASRYAWAASRNVDATRVHTWFYTRKLNAKKAGTPISNETYDISLEPFVAPVGKEPILPLSPPPPSPTSYSDTTDVDLSSDDTLVSFGADCSRDQNCCVPHRSLIAPALPVACAPTVTTVTPALATVPVSASLSVTPVPALIRLPTLLTFEAEEEYAYMRHYGKPHSPTPEASDLDKQNPTCSNGPMQTSSLDEDKITSAYRQKSSDNQGNPELSDCTCALCEPVEDYSQIDQLIQHSSFPWNFSPTVFPMHHRLDPTADTLMELSAIPYLSCTPPPLVIPTPSYSSASWIEEELTRVLVENRFELSSVRNSEPLMDH